MELYSSEMWIFGKITTQTIERMLVDYYLVGNII